MFQSKLGGGRQKKTLVLDVACTANNLDWETHTLLSLSPRLIDLTASRVASLRLGSTQNRARLRAPLLLVEPLISHMRLCVPQFTATPPFQLAKIR